MPPFAQHHYLPTGGISLKFIVWRKAWRMRLAHEGVGEFYEEATLDSKDRSATNQPMILCAWIAAIIEVLAASQ
jgi:hypothetical protein